MFDCLKKKAPKRIETNDGIPKIMRLAFEEAEKYGDRFGTYRFIAFCDLGKNSADVRFWIYDKSKKKLHELKTSHGSGGANRSPHNGKCREVSNTPGSHMSCIGMFKCAETYVGRNGYSMRLDGLSSSNGNARSRAIVIHDHPGSGQPVGKIEPRSWGCFMFSEKTNIFVIDCLKNGSPLFVVHR